MKCLEFQFQKIFLFCPWNDFICTCIVECLKFVLNNIIFVLYFRQLISDLQTSETLIIFVTD